MNEDPPRWSRAVVAVVLFTAAYILAAILGAILSGNREFLIYIGVMSVLIVVLVITHLRIKLSAPLLWALSIWGASHMAGGLVPVPGSWPIEGPNRVLYSWWIIPAGEGGSLKYDHIAHAYGFGVCAWLVWALLEHLVRAHGGRTLRPTFGAMTIVVVGACGFGALNELVEFTATRVTPTNVGGYVNTGFDLVSNTAGAMIAAVVIRLRYRERLRGAAR